MQPIWDDCDLAAEAVLVSAAADDACGRVQEVARGLRHLAAGALRLNPAAARAMDIKADRLTQAAGLLNGVSLWLTPPAGALPPGSVYAPTPNDPT